jgi:hypothetical protein
MSVCAAYWLLEGSKTLGPFTPEEVVWRVRGDLNVLIRRQEEPDLGRWSWKLGRFFPELLALQQLLPD